MRFSKARSVLSISAFEEFVEGQILFGVASGIEDGEPRLMSLVECILISVVLDIGFCVQVVVVVHILIG